MGGEGEDVEIRSLFVQELRERWRVDIETRGRARLMQVVV